MQAKIRLQIPSRMENGRKTGPFPGVAQGPMAMIRDKVAAEPQLLPTETSPRGSSGAET